MKKVSPREQKYSFGTSFRHLEILFDWKKVRKLENALQKPYFSTFKTDIEVHFVEAKWHFWSFEAQKSIKNSLWNPLGGRERVQDGVRRQNAGHFGAKIGPKLIQNRPKIEKIPIPKPTLNSIAFFDRFLIKFWSILKQKWDQIWIKFYDSL